MTYLVCSPMKIICSNVSVLIITVSRDLSHVVFGLEVSWNVQLVHADGRRCPASSLERIEEPASPVISAGILLSRGRAMDLNHCVQYVLDMLFVRQGRKPKSEVPIGVARQHDSSTGGIQLIAGIADAPNPWDISGRGTTAKNWLLVVFPETSLKLECNLQLMRTGQYRETNDGEPCLADSRVWHCANCVPESGIKHCP